MTNRKLGNDFETRFCQTLFEQGFWVHNMAQNSAGQPADVIAVRGRLAYLIDCKVCSKGSFALSRIESNQDLAMRLWEEAGNGLGWFALEYGDEVIMISHYVLRTLTKHGATSIKFDQAKELGKPLKEWLVWTKPWGQKIGNLR